MNWPLDFNQSLSVFTNLILAIATVILALENRRIRLAQTNPEIYVNFQPQKEDLKFIDLVIGNSGQGAAFKIEFKINPDFEYKKGEYLSKLSFIQEGIPYLAPNQILKSYLIWLEEVGSMTFDELAKPFNIEVNYENNNGKKFKRIYPMDLSPYGSVSYRVTPSIPKNIEKIEEHFSTISSDLKTLIKLMNNKLEK